MQALRFAGFLALVLAAGSSAGCDADDDSAPSAGSGGTSGTQGGSGWGGSDDASGGSDTSSGGTSSGGDASASAGGTSTSGGGTSSGGDAASSNGDAGDANAGASGASAVEPYANVVAVTVASGSDGAYTFAVSIESADIDCSQFANWWEVLTEDGALSYRRILDHSHTDANGQTDSDKPGNTFTRTGGPVPVAADTVVLVRAHMNTGGYNGQVMRGSAAAGFVQAPDIGPDFAADVESAEPQSTTCTF